MLREGRRFDLLEYLSFKADCMYLSDLSQPDNLLCIQHTLRDLSPEAFSLKEWNDAAAYITRQDCSFETAEQTRQFLLSRAPL